MGLAVLCRILDGALLTCQRFAKPDQIRSVVFECERLRPVLDLGLRLGEGTGAAIAIQVLEDAVAVYNGMATFAEMGITPGA